MALICPACGTENRAVARFCIECIGVLEPEFPPTQVVPRALVSDGTTLIGMPTALAEFAAPKPLPPLVGRRGPGPVRIASASRRRPWLGIAAAALVIAVGGAAGWMVIGAGPHGDAAMAAAVPTSAAAPAAPAAAAVQTPVATAVLEAPTVPAVAATVAEAPAATVAAAAPMQVPAHQPQATPRASSTAPSAARQRPAPTDGTATVTAAVPAAPAISAASAARPSAQCAGLNFFAESRCMVAQCERPEFRQHAECAAVLAQQRLMEEKRNPTQ